MAWKSHQVSFEGGYSVVAIASSRGPGEAAARQFDLDWLRVIAMFSVFLFHVSQFFNTWGWHVKNTAPSTAVSVFSLLLVQWIMPTFFVISGMSAGYSLGRRNTGTYFKERAARLLPPLALGIFLLAPPQVYVERFTQGGFAGSFLEFIPHYFDGFYAFGGNFAWMGLHLWYVLLLFLFSLFTYPLFRRMTGHLPLEGLMQTPRGPLLLAVVPLLLEIFLDPNGVGVRDMGGWNPFTYLTLFIYGFLFFRQPGFKRGLRSVGPWALAGVVLTQAALTAGLLMAVQPTFGMTGAYVLYSLLRAGNSFLWILGLFYLADRFLQAERPGLGYWSRALMPFYILHQPVIVLLGFGVRELTLALPLKILVVGGGSFALIVALYQWVVRPVKSFHALFGMK